MFQGRSLVAAAQAQVRGLSKYCLANSRQPASGAVRGIRRISSDAASSGMGSGPGPRMSNAKRLFNLARPEAKSILLAGGFLVFSSGVTLSVPYFIGSIIDTIYTQQDRTQLGADLQHTAVFLTVLFLLGALANGSRIYFLHSSGQRIIQRLRKDLFKNVIQADVSFFDKAKTGELVNRLSVDTAVVGSSLTGNVSDGLRSALQVLGGVSLMVYTSPALTVSVLSMLTPVVLLAATFGRYLKRTSHNVQHTLASASEFTEERMSNIRLVRGFAREGTEMGRYAARVEQVLNVAMKEVRVRSLFFTMTGLSGNLMILAVLYSGGMMVNADTLSVGSLSSFILYATYVGISLGGLSNFYTELMKALGATSRIWELLDYQPLIPVADASLRQPLCLTGDISFAGVSFAYPARPDVPVLRDFSLRIPPGRVTALVGRSGCGKSTVAALLMRYYDVTQGDLLVDGLPIASYCPTSLRSHMAFVTQDPILFSCSIRENIEYGARDDYEQGSHSPCSEQLSNRVRRVAEDANCLQFIDTFPSGFDTLVGERGVMLSGGQKQRLSIARAILRDPKILILDEATSALDSESEHLVQSALDTILPGRTVIQIAHRLATIQRADHIVVIDQGSVAEAGSYQELMSKPEGLLAEMVRLQLLKAPAP